MRFQRITTCSEQMDGLPCIRGLRIPVATVVDMVAAGMTQAEILTLYPDLEAEDIREALHEVLEENTGSEPRFSSEVTVRLQSYRQQEPSTIAAADVAKDLDIHP